MLTIKLVQWRFIMLNQMIVWVKYGLRRMGMSEEEGQGIIEYALLLVFISIVVIVILTQFSAPLQAIYQNVLDALKGTTAT